MRTPGEGSAALGAGLHEPATIDRVRGRLHAEEAERQLTAWLRETRAASPSGG